MLTFQEQLAVYLIRKANRKEHTCIFANCHLEPALSKAPQPKLLLNLLHFATLDEKQL